MDAAYTLFDSPLGRCGIAWRGAAIIGLALPDDDDDATAERLIRKYNADCADAPPFVNAAIAAVRGLLGGERIDLSDIPLAIGVSAFERRVYDQLRKVPPGETITYSALADRAGSPGAAQAVGMAMGRNPIPVIIPCHRVLAGHGKTGGFSAPGGVATKSRILDIERAGCGEPGLLFENLPLAVRK